MKVLVISDLVAKEKVDIRPPFLRHDHRMVFDSPESHSLYMLHKIGTIVHELVKPARIKLYIGNEHL